MRKSGIFAIVGAALLFASVSASAGQLVYRPTNPTFGGNPLNGTFLLSTAQTQGLGVKSGQQQAPDLSGLNDALGNIGGIGGSGGSDGNGGSGSGGAQDGDVIIIQIPDF